MNQPNTEKAAWDMHGEAVDIIAGLKLISKSGIKSEMEDDNFYGLPFMILVDSLADRLQKSVNTLEMVLNKPPAQPDTQAEPATPAT